MEINWLKYRKYRAGRDPLGVQAVGIHIYGELMPGITNVTDRLRYYSFYPWSIKTYRVDKIKLDFTEYFRRSDFLFGLITKYHHLTDAEWAPHMVGTLTINKALDYLATKGAFPLSTYCESYFQNELGGLGQYYLGALSMFGILERNETLDFNLPPQGVALADSFNVGLGKDVFLRCILEDKVTRDRLDELTRCFCACALRRNTTEYKLLAEYLRGPDDIGVRESRFRRRETLALLFYLLKEMKAPYGYWELLNYLYYGFDSDGRRVTIPAQCKEIAELWKYYTTHEYFSLGLMGMFIGIQHLLQDKDLTMEEIIKGSWELFVRNSHFQNSKYLVEFNAKLKKNPQIATIIEWVDKNLKDEIAFKSDSFSEYNCANIILDKSGPPDQLFVVGLILVIQTIVRLLKQHISSPKEIDFERLKREYPINLSKLYLDYQNKWQKYPLLKIVSELIEVYILRHHMNVGIKKLFSEGISTFRFIREYEKYRATPLKIDRVRKTSPRLNESLQMLSDLKLIRESKEGFFVNDPQIGNEYFQGIL